MFLGWLMRAEELHRANAAEVLAFHAYVAEAQRRQLERERQAARLKELWRVCIHEAGHLLADHLLGLKPSFATVRPHARCRVAGERVAGYVTGELHPPGRERDGLAHGLSQLAGPAAELLAFGRYDGPEIGRSGAAAAVYLYGGREVTQEWQRAMLEKSLAIVRAHPRALRTVAECLYHNDRIRGHRKIAHLVNLALAYEMIDNAVTRGELVLGAPLHAAA